jgi:hypothetical protein
MRFLRSLLVSWLIFVDTMSSRYRLRSKSAYGWSGAQLAELIAEVASALSLEEIKLGGGANGESFLMVSEGEGGHHNPFGGGFQ